MRILIISDTHKSNANFMKALYRVEPIDMILHCGDAEGSEYGIYEASNCPVYIVSGNNDFLSDLPKEKSIKIGKYNVLMTHGHTYYVSSGNEFLKKEARARGFDIVLYGHTHRPVIDLDGDIIAVNPGSLSRPRQEGMHPSFVLMELDRKGEAHFTINYLN